MVFDMYSYFIAHCDTDSVYIVIDVAITML